MKTENFKIKITKNGIYIESLNNDWNIYDLMDDLAWEDIYWIYCDDDGWDYLIDRQHNVYYASDYGFNFVKDLKENGYTFVKRSPYKIKDYVKERYKCFIEFEEGYLE